MNKTILVNDSGQTAKFIITKASVVVPHATNKFTPFILFVGVGGDIKVMLSGMTSFVIFKNISDGTFFNGEVISVHTDTTATNMLMCS